MTILKTSLIAATAGACALGALTMGAAAQDRNPAVDARQGHMRIMALNLGILGNMARGNTDYDAEVAQAAADNLVAMGTVSQRFYWPPGTDTENYEDTRALPALWENQALVFEIGGRYGPAAEGLAAVAGQGLDAMRAAVGPLGGVCGDCHEAFQEER